MSTAPVAPKEASIVKTEQRVGALQQTVNAIAIKDQGTYDRAVVLLATVKEMQEDPTITETREAADLAHGAHKKSLGIFQRLFNPLKAMETTIKDKILEFDRKKKAEEEARARKVEEERQAKIRAEQEKLAREAREKAKKEADERAAQVRKEIEERTRREAAELKSKAAQKKAIEDGKKLAKEQAEETRQDVEQEVMNASRQEIAERTQAMQAAPAPEVRKSYERSSAVSTRQAWCWEFSGTDHASRMRAVMELVQHVAEHPEYLYLLEPEKLIESHPALNKLAIAQKTMCTLPGGRAIDRGGVSA